MIKASQIPRHVLKKVFSDDPRAARMSGFERKYQRYLMAESAAGIVKSYVYQPESLKLGNDCRYTPDFAVSFHDRDVVRYVEVKNCNIDRRFKHSRVLNPYWRDDGDRIRYLWAKSLYGSLYEFVIAMRDPSTGEWVHQA